MSPNARFRRGLLKCLFSRTATLELQKNRQIGALGHSFHFGITVCGNSRAKNNDLNDSLSGIDIRINAESGEPEWSARGADTWSPFRNEPVLLWKGTGAKQNNITCTFDYSPYTHIRIDFKDSKSLLLKCGTTPIVLAEWSAYYSNSIGRRLISFISSGITCNTLDASGNGGAYMIPLAIYGIK